MLLVNRYAAALRATLAAGCCLVLGAASVAEEGPLLAPPATPLADVIPLRVLDDIEAPAKPLRVATRPTLDWRPGLKKTSDKLAEPAPKAETPQLKKLKPVDEPPQLVAPQQAKPIDQPSEEPEAASEPAQTELLPMLIRRRNEAAQPAKPAAEPDPAPTPEPAEAAPVEPEPLAEPAPATEPKPVRQAAPRRQPRQIETTKPTPEREPEPEPAPKVVKPAKPPAPLTRSLMNLRAKMRTVLSFYYRKPLNTAEHDPWEIMHSMLSYELHSRVRDGGPKGPYMTAVGHLCFNRPSARQRMMTVTEDGFIDTQIGVGLQGHKGQFLSMLAQCNVSPEYPIRVQDKDFKIRDLIESEQRTCVPESELSFKLIGLGHYLDSDAEWLSDDGQRWDIPRLIKEEREQPIRGVACGGTHRLMGLSLAFRRREARGEPVDGEYAEAAKLVSQYQAYAFRLQNEDGSLSTEWFRGPGDEEDIDRRLRTTGHLVEWLVASLPEEQLRSYRMVRAVNYLTNLLAKNADHEWHLGSIGHGVHALVLYDKRVFLPHDQDANQTLAAVDPTGHLFRDYPIRRGVMQNSPPESQGLFGGLFGNPRTSSSSRNRR